jgi:iron complex outermembrane receptor protein
MPAIRHTWQASGCRAQAAVVAILIVLPEIYQAVAQLTNATTFGPEQLGGLEIEQLMTIKVTTAARKLEAVSDTAAAVSVLTQDDIRRSGFETLADVLRLVPGLDVARLDSHDWAVSARGFNDVFANKLQVLVDGQSIYTPLFSGVFWDSAGGLMLEDIDHIEVVRGPGASIWGANAVNGVINIITKSAQETTGGLVEGYGGTEQRVMGGVRYGGALSTNIFFRAYVRYQDTASATLETGPQAYDSWDVFHGGFRLDWDAPGENLILFKGELYDGHEHEVFTLPTFIPPFSQPAPDTVHFNGGTILSRWTHGFSPDSNLQLQFYFDESYRKAVVFIEDRQNYDLDFQHRLQLGARNDVVWGLGYRASSDDLRTTPIVSFSPSKRTLSLFSAFAQDELTLIESRLSLILGSKFEHNDFTGFEVQPTARLLWRPGQQQTFWLAVSRAVRTPSRAESDIRLNEFVAPPNGTSPVPTEFVLLGSPSFDSEKLLAYEIGYRTELQRRVFFDIAGFYNHYTDLRTLEPAQPFVEAKPGPPHLVFPSTAQNLMQGDSFGAEAAVTWRATDWWQLRPAYSFQEIQLQLQPGSKDTSSLSLARTSPRHQVTLLSRLDLGPNVDFDSNLRFVDTLPSLGIASYLELDLRLAWRPRNDLELSLVGQNLLQAHHLEFSRTFVDEQRTEVDRGFYGKVTWRF